MFIHVVQNGETIEDIANKYGVSVDRVILENEIPPGRLVIGEAIVIQIPKIVYTIQEGDTLGDIAYRYGVTVMQLLRNNAYLSDREYIYPGEEIVISYEENKDRSIETNSYVYPFINMDILKKTLPFLTYLTIISYKVSAEGEIDDLDDTEIIEIAKKYRVVPLMMLEALSTNMEDEINVIHSILTSQEKRNQLIDNLLHILETKGYSGVNINIPYIKPTDRSLYEDFIIELYNRLSKVGYKVYNTFTIRVFQLLSGSIFTGIDYSKLSKDVDGFILITYEYGYAEGVPPGTLSLDTFKRFFDLTNRFIPSEKTLAGISVIGYIWEYPFIPGESLGMSVSYDSALNAALISDSEIKFDETTNTAYFQYISYEEFIVRFWDARSIDNVLKLMMELGLNGISIWNIMLWFPQLWLVINSQYYIEKKI